MDEETDNKINIVILVDDQPDVKMLERVRESCKQFISAEVVLWPVKMGDDGLNDIVKLMQEISSTKLLVDKANTRLYEEFESLINSDRESQYQLSGMVHYLGQYYDDLIPKKIDVQMEMSSWVTNKGRKRR